ncbi:hypothetical protein PHLCEN_2v5912 [Hermanssonia centrifuga]|uniref:Uncharacterized protein n=1 Tax=Hermanssonia centrifuga TaxID=98765 RepID=A0A2R6P180_9APHY|nr:hypothetical protein PHLCEN_2v5912 [Hermanssonia centrifuga]
MSVGPICGIFVKGIRWVSYNGILAMFVMYGIFARIFLLTLNNGCMVGTICHVFVLGQVASGRDL